MVQAIREIVTVGPDGSIHFNAPQLVPGTTAQVIVLIESANGTASSRLEALRVLQQNIKLTCDAAEAWIAEVDAERHASTRM